MKALGKHSVAILGSGESGMGALRLAAKQGLHAMLSDNAAIPNDKKELVKSLGFLFEENGHTIDKIKQFDEVIKSPGIPDNAVIILEIKKAGIPVISEIEFASRYSDAKIIGITGSNGKTTTTLLTTHLLKTAGLDVVSGGNVGNSFAGILVDRDPKYIVLELSSFQLDGIEAFNADIAVLLNITPDHLNRYDYKIENYADSKLRIVKNATKKDLFIFNDDDALIGERLGNNVSRKLRLSTQHNVAEGGYYEEDSLILECKKAIQVLPTDTLPLLGRHNYYNQMAAILIAIELDVPFDKILNGLKTFKNAPHRLEVVAEINGVLFINDSKATNVDAVFYALEAMKRKVIWIAGGVNKGNEYDQIKSLVNEKVRAMICMGKDNAHLIDYFGSDLEKYVEVDSAELAVEKAFQLAAKGDVVLLSPACASFDLFLNYENRGDLFRAAVLALKNKMESNHVRA